MDFKNSLLKIAVISSALSLVTLTAHAVDCEKLFSSMPSHEKENSDVTKQMKEATEACEKKYPNDADSPKADECLAKGLSELADKGNYLAASELASTSCEDGKLDDAKKWLNQIVNDAKAPKEDKDKAAQVIQALEKR